MNAGLVKRADYFAIRIAPSGFSYGGSVGGVFSCAAVSYFRDSFVDLQPGITLESSYAPPGTWTVRATVPYFGLSWTLGGQASGSLEARIYGNHYALDESWLSNFGDLEIYLAGVLKQTWPIGPMLNILAGKWPSTVPLIGIPPIISAQATVPVPDFSLSSGSGSAQGTVTGGYKWVVDGVDETPDCDLPGTLIVPPGVACATSGGTLPSVGATDTWNVTAEAYCSASWAFAGIDTESRSSWVQPILNAPRRYQRIGADYGALAIRYALPLAQQHGQSQCVSHTPPGSPIVTTADNNSTVVPARATLKDFVEAAPHVFEDALNDEPKCLFHREVTVTHTDWFDGGYTFSGSRKDTSEFTGAESMTTDYVGGLMSSEAVTRYWDFIVNPHWSHKLFFKDWAARGEAQDPRLYWCPIRQQWCSVDDSTPAPRNNVILDAIGNATSWHDLQYAVGIRNLGATRFQVVDVTPWTSIAYGAGSEPLWTFGGCTASFGASDITLTPL